jgi:hypothetical protein
MVYRATSPSGKIYIGVTSKTLTARRKSHMSAATSRRGWGNRFRHAVRKYGVELRWEVLEDGLQTHETALEREAHWIGVFGSDDPARGYNANKGGQGPSRSVAEQLQISNAHPVLRSDGRPFISVREAAKTMGLTEDKVGRALRGDRVCCGFTFTRISYEKFLVAKKAWESKHGRNAPEPKYAKQRGWLVSDGQRVNESNAKRGKPLRGDHLLHLREKTQRAVRRSDGIEFASIEKAALASGLTRDQVAYSIKRLKAYDGVSFVSLGQAALSDGRVPKFVVRSDGKRFASIAEAARSVSVTRPQMRYAIEHERVLGGFTFAYDEDANTSSLQARQVARENAKTLKKAAAIPVVRSDGMTFPTLTAAAKSVDVAVSTMMLAVRDHRRINDFHFVQANCSKQVR